MSDREQSGPETPSGDAVDDPADAAAWASEPARAIEDPEALPTSPPSDESARGRFGLRWPRRRRDDEAATVPLEMSGDDEAAPLVPLPLARPDEVSATAPLPAPIPPALTSDTREEAELPPVVAPADASPASWTTAAGVEAVVPPSSDDGGASLDPGDVPLAAVERTAWLESTAPRETTAVIVARTLDIPTPTDAGLPRQQDGDGRTHEALRRLMPVPVNAYMVLLAALSTLITLGYVLVEPSPRWFLVLAAGAVAAGLDGVLRATWQRTFETQEPAPALFMPAMYMLGLPVLVESNTRGLAVIPAALLVGIGFFFIVAAAIGSAHPRAAYYGWARTVATIGAYAAGLSLFSLTYVLDLSLASAVIATGLVGLMLGVEVMREGEVDPAETIGYAAAGGAAVAQWRWGLHFLPLTGYLAGLAVLLGFLVITGILNAQVTRRLDRRTAMEFAAIGTVGMLLVVSVRVAGLA